MKTRLPQLLTQHDEQQFDKQLAQAIMALPLKDLPLQQACTQGGWIDEHSLQLASLKQQESACTIEIEFHVFFTELTGGCNCHDDPASSINQCTLLASFDKADGTTELSLIDE